MKMCSRCKQEKTPVEYEPNRWRCRSCRKEYVNTRRKLRPELALAANERRRPRSREYARQYRKRFPNSAREGYLKRGSTSDGHWAILICEARRRAKAQHRPFSVDAAYLKNLYVEQHGRCFLSGVKLTFTKGSGRVPTNASIDRIVSSAGYVPGNVRLLALRVNEMKSDGSDTDLFGWCEAIQRERRGMVPQSALNTEVA